MTDRAESGRAIGSLLLMLVLLAAGGGWNYYRNLQFEKASNSSRPYKAYSVADLESLRAAHASELEAVRGHFGRAKRGRVEQVGDVGSIAANVEQFRKTTRASSAIREAAADVSARQTQIEELDRELALRTQFGEGFARHMKLLTTI